MKTLNYLLFISFIFLSISNLDAAVVTWIGANGNWDDGNNWDTGSVPKLDDGAIINNGIVTIDSYAEANYIHLNGGDLIVDAGGVLYISPDIDWAGPFNDQVRGMMIENGSEFVNSGSTLLIEPNNLSLDAILIYSVGNITNNSSGYLFFQGDNSRGLHTSSYAGTFNNHGEIVMTGIESGMYLLGAFNNYGEIELETESYAILNRSSFYSSTNSQLLAFGYIQNNSGTTWNQYGTVEVNYSSTGNNGAISMHGLFEIQNSGNLNVNGSFAAVDVGTSGTFRIRGDVEIINDRPYTAALTNRGFLVNHQKGVVTTEGRYGLVNATGAELRNYGIWRMDDPQGTYFATLWNSGVFSNRPKGKLYAEGRINLESGSWFNNQGHMFVLDDYSHVALSGNFNNTGTLNDVHDQMASISNNTSYRVHKITGPLTEGVPFANILDKGSNPGATVLSWYTSPSGNTIAGSYNSSTNTFTPNANAVGLTSLYVRTRINTGGVTRRHELIVENGINSNPSPFITTSNDNEEFTYENLTIAPNPIQNNFSINADDVVSDKLKFDIYNSMGQKEQSGTFTINSNNIEVANHLPSGVYFVRIMDESGIHIETKQVRIIR